MSNDRTRPLAPPPTLKLTDAALEAVLLGKRVVEVSAGLAGQHCGYALAGLGATVVRVRLPGTAAASPLDIGKTTVELDPQTAEDFEALVRLCAGCDLVIEERPPLGWPGGQALFHRLLQRDPRMLVACLSPFGLTGPDADAAAYPLNGYHAGGNAQQIPCDLLRPQDRTRPPLQAGGHWGEAQAGTLAALTALSFMLDAQAHAGTVIDCSKQEALISFNWTEVARFPNEGRAPTRLAPLATIVGGILPAQDGFVQVAAREDPQWAALAQLLQHPEWAEDERYATRAGRMRRGAEISQLLAAETVKFPARHLHRRGREMGIPIAAVLSPADLLADADLAARGAWGQADAAGVRLPRWNAHVTTVSSQDASRALPVPRASTPPARPRRPLEGLRVLDLGWVAMGPFAGYTLAGLGAEVIHIAKPPGKDPGAVDLSAFNYGFDTLNTGKTWVAIDLKSRQGLDLFYQLVAQCDVVLDNFRPGVTRRLGIDYPTLSAINPRLVTLSASTYGERAMAGAYVGYAPVFSALAGLAHFTGYPDGPPAEVSHPVDFFAGSVGVLGIVAGLHRLAATGTGCHIDLAAREAILWSLSHDLARVQLGQIDGRRLGNAHPDLAPHGAYPCQGENKWISIAVGSDPEWQRLCACIGDAALAQDSRFTSAQGRLAHREQIDTLLAQWTAQREVAAAFQQLRAHGVAAFPSVTSEDLWHDAHSQARRIFASRRSGTATRWYVVAPWCIHGQAREPLVTREGVDAAQAVFHGLLGLSQVQIDALQAQGVIATRP